jgi:hypothetical protein
MSQHDDFMEGFRDSSGIKDPEEAENVYRQWIVRQGWSESERIDFEMMGYETGLETGKSWKDSL